MQKTTTYRLYRGEEFIGMVSCDPCQAYKYWAEQSRVTGYEYTLLKWN